MSSGANQETGQASCSNCGAALGEDWILCPECKLVFSCPGCKKELKAHWTVCPYCAHAIDEPSFRAEPADSQSEGQAEALKRELRELGQSIYKEYTPFFEGLADKTRLPHWLVWVLLGEAVFLIHYLLGVATEQKPLADLSWMIGLMIGVCMIFVEAGGKPLRSLTQDLFHILKKDKSDFGEFYSRHLASSISTRSLLSYGVLLGTANAILGCIYGIWYDGFLMKASTVFMYFSVGFPCGLACAGMFGMIRLMRSVAAEDLSIDVDAADGRGGTGFVGALVLKFALMTFVMGIMIATYVLLAPWANKGNGVIRALMYLWAVVPYAVSLAVFFLPVMSLHHRMDDMRLDRLATLKLRKRQIQSRFEQAGAGMQDQERDGLLRESETLRESYDQWNSLSTWPFDFGVITKLVASLLIPAIVFFLEAYGTLKELLGFG